MTKQDILGKITEYDIFRFYLGKDFKLGVSMLSPFREEKHASFNIFMNNKGKMMFKDFGYSDGYESVGDCFEFVKRLYSIDFKDAINMIVSDFGLSTDRYERKINPNFDIFVKKQVTKQKQPTVDFEVYYHDKITSKDIIKNIFNDISFSLCEPYISKIVDDGYISTASFVNFISKNGNEIEIKHSFGNPIIVYHYNNQKVRFYRPKVLKNALKHFGNIPGNEFFMQSYLDKLNNIDYLIITGGQKDAITLNILMPDSFATCSGSESSEISYDYINSLYISGKITNDKVFVFYDNDKVGLKHSKKISKMIGCKYVDFELFIDCLCNGLVSLSQDKTLTDNTIEIIKDNKKSKDISDIMKNALVPYANATGCNSEVRNIVINSIIKSLKSEQDEY
jgi:hypothetical protein